ncbi:hypothetical protein D3874_18435 [Oleomonas cavernae]|uniref:Uncharacterized protein n=1 Tax=Oleomonas cavernae TaxID=2320859 RepID=A0A418WFG1_9PROT|nr:hypothetical protein D3874_18435 [Oleomonas cavernae]
MALRKLDQARTRAATITDQSNFDEGCRMVGPIKVSGNRTLATFIRDSFNDELKFAGVFDDTQTKPALNAALTRAAFSSSAGLTSGWWDLAWTLTNPTNGKSLSATIKYDFSTNFVGEIACKNVAEALVPAVQLLINKTVTSPEFRA